MSSYEYDHRPRENALSIADGPTGGVWITTVEGTRPPLVVHLPAAERVKAARALAGDEYVVTPAEEHADQAVDLDAARAKIDSFRDERDAVHRDLGRILVALGLGDYARPASPHSVVEVEVLPAIEKLKAAESDRSEPINPADVRIGDVVEYEVKASYKPCRILGEVLDIKPDFASLNIHGQWWNAATTYATVRLVSRAEPEPDPEQVEAWIAWLEKADSVGDDTWFPVARELTRAGVSVPSVTVGERDE